MGGGVSAQAGSLLLHAGQQSAGAARPGEASLSSAPSGAEGGLSCTRLIWMMYVSHFILFLNFFFFLGCMDAG